jgi:hypothetical protein
VLSRSQYILSESGTDITALLQKEPVMVVPLCGRAEEKRNEQGTTEFYSAFGYPVMTYDGPCDKI